METNPAILKLKKQEAWERLFMIVSQDDYDRELYDMLENQIKSYEIQIEYWRNQV